MTRTKPSPYTSESDVQSANAYAPISSSMPPSKETFLSEEQPEKAESPMRRTQPAPVTSVSEEQPANALEPISSIVPPPKSAEVSAVQP